jgi:hypothetical protein
LPPPPAAGKKEMTAGETRTSASPSDDLLGIALSRGRVIRVRRKFVYISL